MTTIEIIAYILILVLFPFAVQIAMIPILYVFDKLCMICDKEE